MNIFLTFYVGQIALIHVQIHFYLLSCHHFVLRGCKKSYMQYSGYKTEKKKHILSCTEQRCDQQRGMSQR